MHGPNELQLYVILKRHLGLTNKTNTILKVCSKEKYTKKIKFK